MYFGNYRKLVYLSQKQDAALQERARQAADFLGLAYEYRLTGYGDLTKALQSA
jgi:Tfp pilus assembly protein PilW